MYLFTLLYQDRWLFVYQKELTLKTWFSVKNKHLNCCVCVGNSDDYLVFKKHVLKSSNNYKSF